VSKVLQVDFGALVPRLDDQLFAQGLVYKDTQKLEHLQADADAITRLNLRGYIADSAAAKCRKKLMEQLNPTLVKRNQETVS
jgi:hypothetical protein